MKKLLQVSAVLIAAVLLFAGCKNNVDNGTAPVIHDAFFASDTDNESLTNTKAQYMITELKLNRTTDELVFQVEDPDCDICEISISTKRDFSTYYHWTGLKWNNEVAKFWASLTCGWNIEASNKPNYVQTNSPVYVKAIDSKGNESDVFTIPGITITLN